MPQPQSTTVASTHVGPMLPQYVALTYMKKALAKVKYDPHKMFAESFGIEPKIRGNT